MRRQSWWTFIVILLVVSAGTLLVMGVGRSRNVSLSPLSPRPVSSPQPSEVMAWIPYWDQAAAVASLKRQAELVDTVGVFWYTVRANGTVDRYPNAKVDAELVAWAQGQGMKVLAVITNLPPEDEEGDWDAERVKRLISSDEARAQHVADIMRVVSEGDFDGVNIDYETLTPNMRRDFTSFIEELAQALHAEGKILGVSLETNPRRAMDWRALAAHADHLYLMTYEEHWDESDPGSVASLPWMEEVMTRARRQIPAEKLYVGVPLYGYDWGEEAPARGLTHVNVTDLLERWGPAVKWDEETASWWFTYTAPSGESHEVWYEDSESLEIKLSQLRERGGFHLALWRLGGEDDRVWGVISSMRR